MTLHAKITMPDSHWYPWNLNLSKMWKIPSFFWLEKCLFQRVSPLLLISKNCTNHFRRETSIENKKFWETKTWIFNLFWIGQNVQGYLCKSGMAIFAWRVTWNYPDSLFKEWWMVSKTLINLKWELQSNRHLIWRVWRFSVSSSLHWTSFRIWTIVTF